MSEPEFLYCLHELENRHRDDHDGGYRLVDELCRWIRRLGDSDREEVERVLIKLVRLDQSKQWGIALEVLVCVPFEDAAADLVLLIDPLRRNEVWLDQVHLAVMRLGYKAAAARCANYIDSALDVNRRSVLPCLAALCRLDSDRFLETTSTYFGRVLVSDDEAEIHQGYISAFVRNCLDVDEGLITRLVQRTRCVDPQCATRLSTLIDDYLARDFIARELGELRVANLRRRILSS